jgi:hypothetical protein
MHSEDLPEVAPSPVAGPVSAAAGPLGGAPAPGPRGGLEGYNEGQTLRRCIQQGWLDKRSEGTLFSKCVGGVGGGEPCAGTCVVCICVCVCVRA